MLAAAGTHDGPACVRRSRRRPPRGARRPGGQPGDLRRRRVGFHGRARPDGRGRRSRAVPCCVTPTSAATRSPSSPSEAAARDCCCRPPPRRTSRRGGSPASTPAAPPLAEGLLAARDLVVPANAPATAPGAHWWWCSPTGARHRGPRPVAPQPHRRGPAGGRGAAAVVVDCETSYVRLGLAAELAAQLRAPVLRLEQLRRRVGARRAPAA